MSPKSATGNQTAHDQHAHDQHAHDQHEDRHSIYAAEATGLLLMAVLLLTLVRYWRDIPWSAR